MKECHIYTKIGTLFSGFRNDMGYIQIDAPLFEPLLFTLLDEYETLTK